MGLERDWLNWARTIFVHRTESITTFEKRPPGNTTVRIRNDRCAAVQLNTLKSILYLKRIQDWYGMKHKNSLCVVKNEIRQ